MTASTHKRVVIVTGASRGLGREIALTYARAGSRVVINYQTADANAALVVEEISNAGGEAVSCKANVANADEVESMIKETVARWGRVDVIVNNAGVTKDGLLLRMSETDWDTVVDTNLKGAFHCIRAASKIMSKQREGCIVNVSSIVAVQGREGQANYSASKAGLIGLTKSSAKELGRFNIRVNAILPGYLPTDMGTSINDAVKERVINENALKRCNDPKEVANFICHLSSMQNVSGQVFNLDSRVI